MARAESLHPRKAAPMKMPSTKLCMKSPTSTPARICRRVTTPGPISSVPTCTPSMPTARAPFASTSPVVLVLVSRAAAFFFSPPPPASWWITAPARPMRLEVPKPRMTIAPQWKACSDSSMAGVLAAT